jgi:hypothetical protein
VTIRRKNAPRTWFRRATQPVREFLHVDIRMTEQALRRAHPSAQRFFCGPSLFLLWFLDELERAAIDLWRLLLPPTDSRPSEPGD